MTMLETDVLVVGSGPAGSSAALALSTQGVSNILITDARWTADTPRAHITNARTMEVLRDLGVEDRALLHATPQEFMANNVWCESLAGAELARVKAWGNPDEVIGRYAASSPSRMCDLPQDLLEPVLLGAAAERGTHLRLEHRLTGLAEDDRGVTAHISDLVANQSLEVRAKYVIGADGGRSRVADLIGLPFAGESGLGTAVNVVFEADLTHLVEHRPGVLYWVVQPDADQWAGFVTIRMVRPWRRWLAIFGHDPASGDPDREPETWQRRVSSAIGDPKVAVRVESVRRWQINALVAGQYSTSRVFCAGDAVHRHPPTNGLGSNTSIQDSYNLAWKLAMVLRGQAGPGLLETYTAERQPVGARVVDRAIKSLQEYEPLTQALGLVPGQDAEERSSALAMRTEPGPDGDSRRARIASAVQLKHYEYNAHGVEMGQHYVSSAVIADADPPSAENAHVTNILEAGVRAIPDPDLHHEQTTRPGSRIPHAWVGDARRTLSTLDVVGSGEFTVLTGVGGNDWLDAVKELREHTGLPVRGVLIGPGGDVEDLYGDWSRRRGIPDSGCLLVRPDAHVAWRWARDVPTESGRATDLLNEALRRVLSLEPTQPGEDSESRRRVREPA